MLRNLCWWIQLSFTGQQMLHETYGGVEPEGKLANVYHSFAICPQRLFVVQFQFLDVEQQMILLSSSRNPS